MTMANSLERSLRLVVDLLVAKDYAGLEQLTRGERLKASEIESGVRDYGRTIVAPPQEEFSKIDAVPVDGAAPPAYSVRFRLYTLEEGLSDLEVQATFIESSDAEVMKVELDGILVA